MKRYANACLVNEEGKRIPEQDICKGDVSRDYGQIAVRRIEGNIEWSKAKEKGRVKQYEGYNIAPEPEYWNKASARAKHTLASNHFLVYDPIYSIGCDACFYQLKTKSKISLYNFAKHKGFNITPDDIDEAIQQSLEYILRKPDRWTKTLEKAINKNGIRIPAIACFCRLVRSKFKNIIRGYVKRADTNPLMFTNGEELTELKQWTGTQDFKDIDISMFLDSVFTAKQKELILLRIAGYSVRELAEHFSKSKSAISKTEHKLYKALCSYNELLS